MKGKKPGMLTIFGISITFLLYGMPGLAQIIPKPKKVFPKEGVLVLPPKVNICLLDDPNAQSRFAAEVLNETLKNQFNITTALEFEPRYSQILLRLLPATQASDRLARFGIPSEKTKEAYIILITERQIIIEGFTPRGVFYGAVSMAQIFSEISSPNSAISLGQQTIVDWPDLETRGITQDLSRGQIPSLAQIKGQIDHIARYKMNTYYLYIEDTFVFDSYSAIGKDRSPLNASEIKEIVEYAQKNYVEVIPIFPTLTHQENILNIEQFSLIAEYAGASSLCIACDYTYIYLENALQEIAAAFSSSAIHIGGGISYEAGLGKSQALADSVGGSIALQVLHYERVVNICQKLGKEVLMFGDLFNRFPAQTASLAEKTKIHGYQDENNLTAGEANPGIDWLVLHDGRSVYPDLENSFSKIAQKAQELKENGRRGLVVAHWHQYEAATFNYFLQYPQAWAGVCAWNAQSPEREKFDAYYFEYNYPIASQEAKYIYHTLGQYDNLVLWEELWRHPLLPLKTNTVLSVKKSPIDRIEEIRQNVALLYEAFQRAKGRFTPSDSLNPALARMQLLGFQIDLLEFFVFKIESTLQLQAYLQQKTGELAQVLMRVEGNTNRLEVLRKSYEIFWQYFNRPSGFAFIMKKFTRLLDTFNEIQDELVGTKIGSPLVQSQWIYACPDETNLSPACCQKVVFRKEFRLDSPPRVALMQFIANSEAELRINGQYVDKAEVIAAYSAHLKEEKVRFLDVKEYLREGLNEIIFEVSSYPNYSQDFKNVVQNPAGILSKIYIRTLDKEFNIGTDVTWNTQQISKGKAEWRGVFTRSSGLEIIRPNFLLERPSWIEP
ncbi:MAG: family 20 glycosylhydrolase [Microscillaceae bacterium]|nr:family 20 glycosylhydrolase [Microscillaceae bacterium]